MLLISKEQEKNDKISEADLFKIDKIKKSYHLVSIAFLSHCYLNLFFNWIKWKKKRRKNSSTDKLLS